MKSIKVICALIVLVVVGLVCVRFFLCSRDYGQQCSACEQIQQDKARLPSSETTETQLALLQGHWLQIESGEFFTGHAHVDGNNLRIVYQEAEDSESVELSLVVQYADSGTLYASENDSGLNWGLFEEADRDVLHFEVRTGDYGYSELQLVQGP